MALHIYPICPTGSMYSEVGAEGGALGDGKYDLVTLSTMVHRIVQCYGFHGGRDGNVSIYFISMLRPIVRTLNISRNCAWNASSRC